MTIVPLPFHFGYLLFLFLVWLLWLRLPILCWIEAVRVGILVLFLNLVERLSAFHCWILCWLWVCCKCWDVFPLYSLWWEFLSWMDVGFCQMFFMHLLRWLIIVGFLFPFVNGVYHTDWFVYVEPSLGPWNESTLIMVYDPFYVSLDSGC